MRHLTLTLFIIILVIKPPCRFAMNQKPNSARLKVSGFSRELLQTSFDVNFSSASCNVFGSAPQDVINMLVIR